MSIVTSNTAILTVTNPPPQIVSSVLLAFDSNSVNTGQPDNATASLFDSGGKPITGLPSNASIAYIARDPTVATIQANGSAGDPLQSPITTLKEGSAGFNAVITQA